MNKVKQEESTCTTTNLSNDENNEKLNRESELDGIPRTYINTVKFTTNKVVVTDQCYLTEAKNNITEQFMSYVIVSNLKKGKYNLYKTRTNDKLYYELIHNKMDNDQYINKKYNIKDECTIDTGTVGIYKFSDISECEEFNLYGLPKQQCSIEGQNITFISPIGDCICPVKLWIHSNQVYRIQIKLIDNGYVGYDEYGNSSDTDDSNNE